MGKRDIFFKNNHVLKVIARSVQQLGKQSMSISSHQEQTKLKNSNLNPGNLVQLVKLQ